MRTARLKGKTKGMPMKTRFQDRRYLLRGNYGGPLEQVGRGEGNLQTSVEGKIHKYKHNKNRGRYAA